MAPMKVVYHNDYRTVYASDPAAAPGRMEAILAELQGYELVEPQPASEGDILLVHSRSHLEYVRSLGVVYRIALLAAGGAIKAAELALIGEPVFALIRPPGHHASRDSSWGFCYFNNIAIAVEKMRVEGRIRTAVILDIDLHYGDGTASIFSATSEVTYLHPDSRSREEYMREVEELLASAGRADIIAVSAGFDRHIEDWGHQLYTEDYRRIAQLAKEYSESSCSGRRMAVLEGGYNHKVLGRNVRAFLEGFR